MRQYACLILAALYFSAAYASRYKDIYGEPFDDEPVEVIESTTLEIGSPIESWSYTPYLRPALSLIMGMSVAAILFSSWRKGWLQSTSRRALGNSRELWRRLCARWKLRTSALVPQIDHGDHLRGESVPDEALRILARPSLAVTENVRIMRLASNRPGSIPGALVNVRLKMEEELMKVVPMQKPATALRNRLKELAAKLKDASIEERRHVTEKLADLFSLSFTTMCITFLTTIIWYNGGGVMPDPIDLGTFFGDSAGLVTSAFSIDTLFYFGKQLFVPFGWNLMSVVPYILGFLAIRSLIPVPFIGPFIAHILYFALAVRFFWLLIPSFLTAMVYTTVLVLIVGWPLIRYQIPRWYILVPIFFLSVLLGWLVGLQDPSMRSDFAVQNSLLQACTSIGWCDGLY